MKEVDNLIIEKTLGIKVTKKEEKSRGREENWWNY